MSKIRYEKRVKNFSTDKDILKDKPAKIIGNVQDNFGYHELKPDDIELLTKLTETLQNDFTSILNFRNDVDLIYFEIRCTDIARMTLAIIEKFLHFELRLVMGDDATGSDNHARFEVALNFGN